MAGFTDFLTNVMSPVSAAFDVGASRAASAYPSAGSSSGLSPDALQALAEAAIADNDRRFNLQKQQIDQQYQLGLRSARNAEDVLRLNRWYQEQQVQLAQKRLALDTEVQKSDAAYKRLGLLAQMRGPRNAFRYAALTSGQTDPFSADYLRGLAGQAIPTGQQQAMGPASPRMGGPAEPMTLEGLASDLTGGNGGGGNGGGGGGPNSAEAQNALSWIKQFGSNPGQATGQAFEQLSPYAQNLVAGGLEESGYDPEEVLHRYRQARFYNQGAA